MTGGRGDGAGPVIVKSASPQSEDRTGIVPQRAEKTTATLQRPPVRFGTVHKYSVRSGGTSAMSSVESPSERSSVTGSAPHAVKSIAAEDHEMSCCEPAGHAWPPFGVSSRTGRGAGAIENGPSLQSWVVGLVSPQSRTWLTRTRSLEDGRYGTVHENAPCRGFRPKVIVSVQKPSERSRPIASLKQPPGDSPAGFHEIECTDPGAHDSPPLGDSRKL